MLCVSVASRILAATGAFRCCSKPSRAGTPALVAAAAACEALAVIAMVHRCWSFRMSKQFGTEFMYLLASGALAPCMLCEPSSLLVFAGGGGILAA